MNLTIEMMTRALDLNYKLMEEDIEVVVLLGSTGYTRPFMYLKSAKDSAFDIALDSTDQEVINKAKLLVEPKFIRLKTVCVNIIGEQVYLDKDMCFFVEAITKEGIVCSRYGETYTLRTDNLYIKE
jgi:hypothetical protein